MTRIQDELKLACAFLSAKLQGLIESGVDSAYKEDLLNRLAELESFIDEKVNKTAS